MPAAAAGDRVDRLAAAMQAYQRFRATGGDREAFLAAHAPLRELLEMLLADDAEAGEEPAPGALATPVEPGPGQSLGDYRLLREVGRGGMGIVYEAEQLSLRRRVALKLLPADRTGDARSIERFRREAAAASRLRHPGIVPIHEVGEWRGSHFYSMEFVDGTPLDQAMQQARLGVRSDCSRVAEVAELVARLADVLQHAHDHGLVHRDVKPHNVMIAADGSVRLLDFGLVKDELWQQHSRTGEFLGTPHYSSPEQVAGLSARPTSDVFALGIVLYELLAQRRPFVGDTARLVMRRIELGEFPPLRTVAPLVPRDLQTICHKALEHRPADRYRTASAMAADLRRFLRIEPILATPPGPFRVAGKWLLRHRLRVVLAATAGLLVLGAPAAYALHLHANQAAIAAERAVLAAAEDLGFRSVELTLALLGERLEREPDAAALRQPTLLELAAIAEQFVALRAEVPGRHVRAALALLQVAGIQIRLDAGAAARAACARAGELLANEPVAATVGHDTIGVWHLRSLQAAQLLAPDGGAAEFTAARACWRSLGPPARWATPWLLVVVETLLERAEALSARPDQRSAAAPLLAEAHQLLQLPQAETAPPRRQLEARTIALQGLIHAADGRLDVALPQLRSALERWRGLPASPQGAVQIVRCEAAVGRTLQRLGRVADAEATLQAAIDGAARLLRDFPGSRALLRVMCTSQVDLGSLWLGTERLLEAEHLLRAAEPPAELRNGTNCADLLLVAEHGLHLANCLLAQEPRDDRTAEAERLLHEAARFASQLVEQAPAQLDYATLLATCTEGLAALANMQGRHESALEHAARAMDVQQRVVARIPGHSRERRLLGLIQAQFASAASRVGRHAEAVDLARKSVDNAPGLMTPLRLGADAAVRAAAAAEGELRTSAGRVAVQLLARVAELDADAARELLRSRRFVPLHALPEFQALQQQLGGS